MIPRLLCGVVLWASSLSASAGTIIAVPTEGLKGSFSSAVSMLEPEGMFRCALWVKADGFPGLSEAAEMVVVSEITGPEVSCTFEGVKAGRYAVSILHDANGNTQMDISERGMPREGYGISNNVPAQDTSPPSFEMAQFDFDGEILKLSMLMRYPKMTGPEGADVKGQAQPQQ